MPRKRPWLSIGLGLIGIFAFASCNSILGLNDLSVSDDASTGSGGSSGEGGAECPSDCTNQICTQKATQAGTGVGLDGGVVPAICVKQSCKCAELLSADCTTITGDYTRDGAIVIGSLFQTKGPQAATNLARQNAAVLAVQEIDDPAVGGLPRGTSAAAPLVMVSCNAFVDTSNGGTADTTGLLPAARHLVNDLHVPAIVGPNTSQDTLDVSNKVTIAGATVVVSPAAVADSITGLRDDDLTFLMVPTDVQRAPMMIDEHSAGQPGELVGQIKTLEAKLRAARPGVKVKLGVVYRNDALGKGTNDSLSGLVLNDLPAAQQLADPPTQAGNILIRPYAPANPDQDAQTSKIVTDYMSFQPDIIVLAGTAEAVSKVLVPLEGQLASAAATQRPYYVNIDSSKVVDLTNAIAGKPVGTPPVTLAAEDAASLRRRVRGFGITQGAQANVFNKFSLAYQQKYPGADPNTTGVGSSYDATYAVALALASIGDQPLTGKNVVKGLRKLAGGTSVFNTGQADALKAFQKLAAGEQVTVYSGFGPLAWNEQGAVLGGTLEVWCIGDDGKFTSAGLTYDLSTKQPSGANNPTKCGWAP